MSNTMLTVSQKHQIATALRQRYYDNVYKPLWQLGKEYKSWLLAQSNEIAGWRRSFSGEDFYDGSIICSEAAINERIVYTTAWGPLDFNVSAISNGATEYRIFIRFTDEGAVVPTFEQIYLTYCHSCLHALTAKENEDQISDFVDYYSDNDADVIIKMLHVLEGDWEILYQKLADIMGAYEKFIVSKLNALHTKRIADYNKLVQTFDLNKVDSDSMRNMSYVYTVIREVCHNH